MVQAQNVLARGSRFDQFNGRRQRVAVEKGTLRGQRGSDSGRICVSEVGEVRRCNPRSLTRRKRSSHDPQGSAYTLVPVRSSTSCKKIARIRAHETTEWYVVGGLRGQRECALERFATMELTGPRAERDSILKTGVALNILPPQLVNGIEMARLPRSEFGTTGYQVSVLATR